MKTITCTCGQTLVLFSRTQCWDCKAVYEPDGQRYSDPKAIVQAIDLNLDMLKPVMTSHRPTQQGLWDVILTFKPLIRDS